MAGRACPLAVLSPVPVAGVVLLLCLLSGTWAAAQTAGSAQPPPRSPEGNTPPAVNVEALPISLNRIGEQLEKTPVLDLSAARPTFRMQIFGTRPRWTTSIDWLGTANGGRPPVGMPWHDQFLNMVTPPEARGFGAFQGTDLLQVMATSVAQGLAVGAVTGKIKATIRERREREARAEVDAAIAAWRKERDAETARKASSGAPPAPASTEPQNTPPPPRDR